MTHLSTLGQYRIEAELGSGRFCETYRAYDTVRRRPATLKLLRPDLLQNAAAFRDFLSQVGQAAELVHPHIAWVWECGEIDGHYFLVERFINGPSLAGRLAEAGVIPWEQARQVVDQLAQGLEFAFSKGWVHGRVTPHNILLGPDQTTVLSDFGLQRALHSSKVSAMLQISAYDAQYLAPEVLQGKPVSPATDGYALACTLLEMLAGKNPFAADSLAEIEQKHLAPLVEPYFPPENAPWQIKRVLEKALSPEPSERYPNATALVAALNLAISPGGTDPEEVKRQEAQVQAWREAEQQNRQEAEESARRAAVEQARREIQEQARREVAALGYLEPEAEAGEPAEDVQRPATPRRRKRRSPARSQLWAIGALAALVLVVLAGYWLNSRLSPGGLGQATPTATTVLQPAVLTTEPVMATTAPATETSAPTQTSTPTATARPSATSTRTNTATLKATLSPSSTPEPTFTSRPLNTFTPEKPERRDNEP